MSAPFRIEWLTKSHKRKGFDCGEPSINVWFRQMAIRAMRDGTATVHVMIDNANDAIAGFYSLNNFSVIVTDLPTELAGRLPGNIPTPTHLIGRLGRDIRYPGIGIGSALVNDALARACFFSQHSASVGVVVDALDEKRADWYAAFGFVPFPASPLRLVMAMSSIASLGLSPPRDLSPLPSSTP